MESNTPTLEKRKFDIIATDDRGTFLNLTFPEGFSPKRVYTVKNSQKGVVRAWHGHRHEAKMFHVVKGRVMFQFIPMGDDEHIGPVDTTITLSDDNPEYIVCPAGYYNGFMSLTDETVIQVYSTSTVSESSQDDYRHPYDVIENVWEVRHR